MQRFDVIKSGFTGDAQVARIGLTDDIAAVRASALRALARMSQLTNSDLISFTTDSDSEVRRTVAELSATIDDVPLLGLLHDSDIFVAEMTAWSLGEKQNINDHEIAALIDCTTQHEEPIVREACAAALGSLGDERGLQAILAACKDKPAVRRRAVLALAPFDGAEVDAALALALQDKDWQVRQNAEDLINPRG